ncbi:flagellar hook capping FlgD N-terminal domain-containing protein [Agromyces humi]|uniref:flagellar hook capping FlgD N-terminal domain-containing protein n=1 Tax=Agromyces humi TaxID=1766800 RepID=UPI00135792B4|nr:flagellar hook capping FlgD N-terminal domain-containing protein [Agromyces humi]
MTVEAVSSTGASMYSTPQTRAPKQEMDGEMFLQLLITQMQYQDPTSPMDTSQMMAQTAQLASMEQLTNMSKLSEESFALNMRSSASALIGREVTYKDKNGDEVTGIASSVSFTGSVPTVTVGDTEISLDAISGIKGS